MSRGLGLAQRAILQYLDGREGKVTLETLRWDLWKCQEGGDRKDLPNKWNTSVGRALDGLAEQDPPRVRVKRRRLHSLDELVAHYPQKTLRTTTRRLRIALLPALVAWSDSGGPGPQYSTAANEDFYREQLDRNGMEQIRWQWLATERRLLELLPHLEGEQQTAVFLLIAKGKSIFGVRDVECRRGFSEYAKRCVSIAALPTEVADCVTEIADWLLPPSEAGPLKVKSYVHRWAHIPAHGGCSLKDETIGELDRACPEVVRVLPGYEPPQKGYRGRFMVPGAEARHSPELHRLIDQQVFSKFRFVMPS